MATDEHDLSGLLHKLAEDPEAAQDFARFVQEQRESGELSTEELETLSGGVMGFDPTNSLDMLKLQSMMQKWAMATQLQSNTVKSLGETPKSTGPNLP